MLSSPRFNFGSFAFYQKYLNNLHCVSNKLEFIVIVDDTNIFFSDRNIKNLFQKANDKLQQLSK